MESLRIVEELWATEDSRENHEELLRRSVANFRDLSESFEIWVADGRFLLDRIEALAADDPMFGGRLDLDRIGVFGVSFGGAMAAEVCRVDARCVAGINLDGTQYGMVVDSGVPRPFMFMYSEPERWLNHIVAVRSTGPVYQVAIMGSGHLDFADLTRFTPLMSWGSRSEPFPMVGTIGPDRMHEITKAYVLAFFDRYLRGRGSPLLEGPSLEYPEVRFEARP